MFENGARHGKGIKLLPCGGMSETHFQQDKEHGEAIFKDADGNSELQTWKYGVKESVVKIK